MKVTRAVVPSLFTVLNIFSGYRSIVHSAEGEFHLAAWFIILAGLFDTLDGLMARVTKSSSSFGVELDSLSDVVSFGAAPSFMVYQAHLAGMGGIGLLISSMPMVFGALRLARFNSQLVGFTKDHFKGLPIPAQAIALCAFVLACWNEGAGFGATEGAILAPLVAVLSVLMVSSIRYETIPSFSRHGIAQHPVKFVVFVAGLTAILITMGKALLPVLGLYIISGPIRYGVMFIRNATANKTPAPEEETEITSVDV